MQRPEFYWFWALLLWECALVGENTWCVRSFKAMGLLKTRHLINALPFIAIAAMIGLIVYQQWQQTLQSRPDYDNPNAAPGRYSVKVTESQPQSEHWQVEDVASGEVIIVAAGWKKEKIRLCGINVPESLAEESRKYLKQQIDQAKGKAIVVPSGRDRSNRIIGEVFVSANTNNPEEEKLLNLELVMAGLAYHYSQYSSGCSSRAHLIEAEESARSAHRGIWVKSKDKLTPKL